VKKIEIAKKIVSTIVGIGTTKIVHSIIENNIDPDTTTAKVTTAAASGAIGFAASEYMSSYTDAKIDEVVTWWTKNITKQTSD
jgi:hypothetical protein